MEEGVGIKIVQRRKEKGISQKELAEKLKVDRGYLSKVENGKIKKLQNKTLLKLCEVLEVPIDYFGTREQIIPNYTMNFDLSLLDNSDLGRIVKLAYENKTSVADITTEIIHNYFKKFGDPEK